MNHLYYWGGHRNVGDELSLYLVEKISKQDFSIAYPPFNEKKTIAAIGSILSCHVFSKNLVVWGTGTLTEFSLNPRSLRLFPFSRLISGISERLVLQKPDVRAVRGPRTRALLEKKGVPCAALYGDPAILTPFFYDPKPCPDKFRIGLILHQVHLGLLDVDRMKDIGIRFISVDRESDKEIEEFIDEICSCDFVYSSSLHGIILAQSYGIPAQWIQIAGNPIQNDSRHKFEDYFLGAGQTVQDPIKISVDEDSLIPLLKKTPPKVFPFKFAQSLLDSFPYDVLE